LAACDSKAEEPDAGDPAAGGSETPEHPESKIQTNELDAIFAANVRKQTSGLEVRGVSRGL
jgi:hypothetical protein